MLFFCYWVQKSAAIDRAVKSTTVLVTEVNGNWSVNETATVDCEASLTLPIYPYLSWNQQYSALISVSPLMASLGESNPGTVTLVVTGVQCSVLMLVSDHVSIFTHTLSLSPFLHTSLSLSLASHASNESIIWDSLWTVTSLLHYLFLLFSPAINSSRSGTSTWPSVCVPSYF